jgi:hypothetical protein
MAQSCLTVKTLREIWLTKGLVEHRLDAGIEGAAEGVELGRAVGRRHGRHGLLGKVSRVGWKEERVFGEELGGHFGWDH